MPNKTCPPIRPNVCLRVNSSFLKMPDVAKNTMNPPINAPTHAGTANKVGAAPFAVEAVIALYIFSSATIGFTKMEACVASIFSVPSCAKKIGHSFQIQSRLKLFLQSLHLSY